MDEFKKYCGYVINFITGIKDKLSDKNYRKSILEMISPEPFEGSDYLADYMTRILLLLFPLYIYESTAVLSISMKDMFFGIIILIMSIWCLVKFWKKAGRRKVLIDRRMICVSGIFLLILICFAVQLACLSSELGHTYLYIGMFLLPFCVSFIGRGTKYYMHIFLAVYVLVYISIFSYVFTGIPTILGVESLLNSSAKLIPSILLSCCIGSFLYITADDISKQRVYLAFTTVSMVVLFMYGDMVSFMILLIYLMLLQFLRKPVISFVKRNLILLFAFAFCASNTPLITYFGVKGYSREFDLEYSIYIDIIIAVVGLFITSYWDKMPKDQDEDIVTMPVFSLWFKRSILLVVGLLAVAFIFGSRGGSLEGTFGGKAISGFSKSLWDAVNMSSGELWHILSVYGVIGVVILLFLGFVILSRLYKALKYRDITDISKGFIIISLVFLVQSFFYPFSSAATPAYLIFLGFALCAAPVEDKAADKSLDKDVDIATDKVWDKEDSKDIEIATMLAPQVCVLLIISLSSALVVMVFFAIYRVFVPVGSLGSQDSLVEIAIEHRQEQLLAMEQVRTDAYEGSLDEGYNIGEAKEVLEADGDIEKSGFSGADIDGSGTDGSDEDGTDKSVAGGGDLDTGDSTNDEGTLDGTSEEDLKSEDDSGNDDEAKEEESGEEESGTDTSNIEAGISNGDYKIYDPNAHYKTVDETVTGSRGDVNLRSIPSMENGSQVIHVLKSGETVRRTAIGENGWSKVEYNGRTLYAVSSFLKVATQEGANEPSQEPVEEVAQETVQEPVDESVAQASQESSASESSKEDNKSKTKSGYSFQWTNNNKTVSIWSAGVYQGSMTVTDGDGNSVTMINYGVYYQGSGKDQKKYMFIGAAQGDTQLTLNADGGFIAAMKEMGYSGVYFNKTINNW
jgi:hypothetical protein